MDIERSQTFKSANGYLYVYSPTDKCWYELHEVALMPLDIIYQVKEFQEKALILKDSLSSC